MSIKYYRLAKDEELPEEFCVVRDVGGEPEEYTWYEPMDSFDRELWSIIGRSDWVAESEYRKLKAENAKLRELCKSWHKFSYELFDEFIGEPEASDDFTALDDRMRELEVG